MFIDTYLGFLPLPGPYVPTALAPLLHALNTVIYVGSVLSGITITTGYEQTYYIYDYYGLTNTSTK